MIKIFLKKHVITEGQENIKTSLKKTNRGQEILKKHD